MEKNKLEFNTVSMSDMEYRLMELSSISPEDFDLLEKDRQMAFVHVRDDMDVYTKLLINIPLAWIKDEESFKIRFKTDLKEYVTEAVKAHYMYALNVVGTMIDYMGLNSFMNYIPYDTDDLMDIPASPTFRPPDSVQRFMWKMVHCCVMSYDLLNDNEFYDDIIDNSLIVDGKMAFKIGVVKDRDISIEEQLKSIQPNMVKDIMAMQIDMNCWYELDHEDEMESYKSWAALITEQYQEHLRLASTHGVEMEESNG